MILTPWPEYRDIWLEDVARGFGGTNCHRPVFHLETKRSRAFQINSLHALAAGLTTTSEQITCCSIKIPLRSARHALSLWGQWAFAGAELVKKLASRDISVLALSRGDIDLSPRRMPVSALPPCYGPTSLPQPLARHAKMSRCLLKI